MPTEPKSPTLVSYRKAALAHYRRQVGEHGFNLCVVCGFGVQSVLEVAHLNQDRKDNAVENLAVLCPNCHKMHDIGLIPSEVVRSLRDNPAAENWKLRIKDAGAKAAATRGAKRVAAKKSAAAKKAWASRTKPATNAE
jgi:5-methylcytosine-specific restriction endonuclease McrA